MQSLIAKNHYINARILPSVQTRAKANQINFRKAKERKNELLKRKEDALSRYNENIMKEKNIFKVNLVGENNELLGEMSTTAAIEMAKKLSLQKHRLCVVLVDVCICRFTLICSRILLPLLFSKRKILRFVSLP